MRLSKPDGIHTKLLEAQEASSTFEPPDFGRLSNEYVEASDMALREHFALSQRFSAKAPDIESAANAFGPTAPHHRHVISTATYSPPFTFLEGLPVPPFVIDGNIEGTVSRAATADATSGIIELAAGIGTLGTAYYPSIATPPILATGVNASLIGLVPTAPTLSTVASALFKTSVRVHVDFRLPEGMGQKYGHSGLPGHSLSYRLEASGNTNARVTGSLGVRLSTSESTAWNTQTFFQRWRDGSEPYVISGLDLGGTHTVTTEVTLAGRAPTLEVRGMASAVIEGSVTDGFAGFDLQERAPVTPFGPVVRPSPLADGVPPGTEYFQEGGAFGNFQRGGIEITAIRVETIREDNAFGGLVET